jgi:DNA-nicking Smr family endonuclease
MILSLGKEGVAVKRRKAYRTFHSFQELRNLPKGRFPLFLKPTEKPFIHSQSVLESEDEEKTFVEAMQGVIPIRRDNCLEQEDPGRSPKEPLIVSEIENEESWVLSRLASLIENGEDFRICDTPEYIEGTASDVPPMIARWLHQGRFAIQAHLDLHGMKVEDAQEVFGGFIRRSILTGKRGLLIIHGRGLSSPAEPILKAQVIEWLTHGPWRKYVLAYSTARHCDGGPGATYVLLRPFAVSRKKRPPRGRKG